MIEENKNYVTDCGTTNMMNSTGTAFSHCQPLSTSETTFLKTTYSAHKSLSHTVPSPPKTQFSNMGNKFQE